MQPVIIDGVRIFDGTSVPGIGSVECADGVITRVDTDPGFGRRRRPR
ncbi:Amidohydrolase family protein OS=Streptomyces rimosus subsp. rimosus (strain ATCC /DSM 40260 / JCM 4667 / NRRL 2234) OX=1265868 GN=SRIM_002005 PE=4 SV=1 [Streptomyces rimosus subsp. rimosus]